MTWQQKTPLTPAHSSFSNFYADPGYVDDGYWDESTLEIEVRTGWTPRTPIGPIWL